ncbi:MAG: TolC family protein [Candidatus Altimarinota bacterium]
MRKLLFILFSTVSVYADTSFEEIVSKVVNNHPSINMLNEGLKSAKEGTENAKWQYYPTPSIDFSRSSNGLQSTAKLEQPLWTAGKLDANYKQALLGEQEAVFTLEEKKYQLIEIIISYIQNYIQAKLTKEALIDGIKRLDNFTEMIDRRISAGVSSSSDKRLLESRLTQIKSDLISSENKEKTALKQISLLTGEEINEINFIDNINLENISLEELVSKTVEFHPSIYKLDEKIEIAIYEIDKQESSLYPTLTLNAEHTRGSLYDESNEKNNSIYFKLQSQFGAGLSSLSNINQAKIEVQKLKYEKKTLENDLIDGFWQDYNNLTIANNKIKNYMVSKKLAEEVFQSNERLFLADKKQWLDLVNSSKEVMDIDISIADSKVMFIIGKYKIGLRTGLIDLDNGTFSKSSIQSKKNNNNFDFLFNDKGFN